VRKLLDLLKARARWLEGLGAALLLQPRVLVVLVNFLLSWDWATSPSRP